MDSNLKENRTRIGTGTKIVTFKYKTTTFGPIFVKTDNEVRQILDFCKHKKKEHEFNEAKEKTDTNRGSFFLKPLKDLIYLNHQWSKNLISLFNRNFF